MTTTTPTPILQVGVIGADSAAEDVLTILKRSVNRAMADKVKRNVCPLCTVPKGQPVLAPEDSLTWDHVDPNGRPTTHHA